MAAKPFFHLTDRSILLRIKALPGAQSDCLREVREFPDGERLVLTVRAVPDKGKANTAICKLLALELELAKSRLAVVSGSTGRLKTVAMSAENSDEAKIIMKRLEKIRAGLKGDV